MRHGLMAVVMRDAKGWGAEGSGAVARQVDQAAPPKADNVGLGQAMWLDAANRG